MNKEMIDIIINKLDNINNDNIAFVQEIINNNKDSITSNDYKKIIKKLLKSLNIESDNIVKLFETNPKVYILSLKKVLKIYAERHWEEYKEKHKSLFVDFSKNICSSLDKFSLEKTLEIYEKPLNMINNINSNDYNIFLSYLKGYKENNIIADKYKYKDLIKDFTRKFNAKFKEIIINNYIEKDLNNIKSSFEIKGKKNHTNSLINKNIYINFLFSFSEITDYFKNLIKDKFEVEILNDKLRTIISNMLNSNDNENYKILHIKVPLEYEKNIIEQSKAQNRFKKNFLIKINEEYTLEEKEAIIDLLNNNKDFSQYSSLFPEKFYSKYLFFKSIFDETDSTLFLNDNNIMLKPNNEYDNLLISSIKDKNKTQIKYSEIKKELYRFYSSLSKSQMDNLNIKENETRIFDDDNYTFNNNVKLLNIDLILNILKHINIDMINQFNSETINEIKQIIFLSGLLGSVLVLNDKNVDIANIINNFKDVKKYAYDKNNNINFDIIVKRSNLFNVVDDFTLSLLGNKVSEKLVNDRQFLQVYNKKIINERLEKADYLFLKSEDLNKSSVPYVNIFENDIKIVRYNNNDRNLLTSGIDTNTCFSLCANDNDYVFYTILNKNGCAFKIMDNDNKFIGRASAHLMGNTLFINGIRTYDEKDTKISKEKALRNRNIFETITKLANTIIEATSNNSIPIDYVVCNKAGILESSLFDCSDKIIDENIYKRTSIDIYNDDWKQFLEENKQYLYESDETKSFTTDYGHFPAILLASRNNKFLNSIRDVAIYSEEAIYERPRKEIKINFNGIIDFKTLEQINSINARKYFYENNCDLNYCRKNYVTRKIDKFYKLFVGEDWYCLFKNENEYDIVMTHENDIIKKEINDTLKIDIKEYTKK